MAAFSELSLLYAGREAKQRLVLRVTNVKLLATAVMVDSLAEKVDKCPLNRGH